MSNIKIYDFQPRLAERPANVPCEQIIVYNDELFTLQSSDAHDLIVSLYMPSTAKNIVTATIDEEALENINARIAYDADLQHKFSAIIFKELGNPPIQKSHLEITPPHQTIDNQFSLNEINSEAIEKINDSAGAAFYSAIIILSLILYYLSTQFNDNACKVSIECWEIKNYYSAAGPCRQEIEAQINREYKWTDKIFSRKFPNAYWPSDDHEEIVYFGSNIMIQNKYGAFEKNTYECSFNPINNKVTAIFIQPPK